MRVGWALGAAAFAVGIACAHHARAEPPALYGLSYKGAPGCPSEDEIRASVASNVHDTSRAAGARVDLSISLRGDTFVGELVATDQEGTVGHRSIDGEKGNACAEVARALGFMAGLAIEYGGSIEPKAPAPPPPPPPPKSLAAPAAPPPPPPPASVAFAIVVGGDARGGLAGAPRPAGEIALEIFDPRPRVLAPALRLGAVVGASHLENATGGADLWLFAARLEACPMGLGGSRLLVRPCASMEGGAVSANGDTVVPARSATEPWFVAEATLRADLFVTSRVFLEASGGAVFPIVATRYFFEPNETLYDVPRVTARGGLAIGVRLGAK